MNEEIKTRIIKSLTDDFNRVVGSGLVLDTEGVQYNVEYIGDSPKIELKLFFRKEEADYIECPMEFERVGYGPNELGIKFGNNQSLYYNSLGKWSVYHFDSPVKTKICKTPTPKDELEVGKWYFCTDSDNFTNIDYIHQYHLYLEEGECAHSTGKDVMTSGLNWVNWYEVVEDEY